MLIVSDATPLNVLIRANQVGILENLFGHVVIPPAVEAELTHPLTPQSIRDWLQARPAWLEIKAPTQLDSGAPKNRGEREAISLAKELHADLLLVDNRRARITAEKLGVICVGTIGVLEAAAVKGLLDLRQALISLPSDFRDRLHPKLIEDALLRDAQRKKR